MFDIGFSELVLIGVVALVVIGPEKLPSVARTLGHLFGRMQRYVNDVKADIQREMDLDELKKLRQSVEDSARSVEQSVTQEIQKAEEQFTAIQAAVDPTRSAEPTPAVEPPGAQPAPAIAAAPGVATPSPTPAIPASTAAATPVTHDVAGPTTVSATVPVSGVPIPPAKVS
jgi:sec-independent protein translocase protein TatB